MYVCMPCMCTVYMYVRMDVYILYVCMYVFTYVCMNSMCIYCMYV